MNRRNTVTTVSLALTVLAGVAFGFAYSRNWPVVFDLSVVVLMISLPVGVLSSHKLRRHAILPITANTISLLLLALYVADTVHHFRGIA